MHYSGQFKNYKSGRKKENEKNNLIFLSILVCKLLNSEGESCDIKILSRSFQEIYTLEKIKN